MPWSVLVGAKASGTTGPVTFNPHASHQTNDVEFLLVEAGISDTPTLSTAAGFALVTGLGNLTGTQGTATTGRTRLNVWWRRWNGTDGSPAVSNTGGNHIGGYIVSVRGAVLSGDPWDVIASDTGDAQDTTVACPSVTTTVNGCLIVCIVAQGLPDADSSNAEWSGWTNANLTNLVERADETWSAGHGGGIGVATGEQATAGSTGTTTATSATSSNRVTVTIALKPAPAAAAVQPNRTLLGVGV